MATLIEDALHRRYYPEENRPLQVTVSQQVKNQQVVSQAVLPPPVTNQPILTYVPNASQWTVQNTS